MKARWFLVGILMMGSVGCSDFFLFASSDKTMTLRGKVTDAATSEPLEGVLVSLQWTFADTAQTSAIDHADTSTMASGDFELKVKMATMGCQGLALFFGRVGYEAGWRVPDCKSGNQTFNLAMTPD